MKRNKAKQQQNEMWSGATMQQVVMCFLLVLKSIVWPSLGKNALKNSYKQFVHSRKIEGDSVRRVDKVLRDDPNEISEIYWLLMINTLFVDQIFPQINFFTENI